MSIDLPLIFSAVIAFSLFMYVLMDGFSLGVGILFRWAPSDEDRDTMMNSTAPIWDGNQTWLVLGGGGLLAAFPLAYSLILPAFYIPFIFMLIALIFRGVAFEFRFKANTSRYLWDYAFQYGAIIATFAQGIILGAYIQGIHVDGRHYAGGAFDWLTPFSLLAAMGLLCGYGLLGATWLILKTEDELQAWAYRVARKLLYCVIVFMAKHCLSITGANRRGSRRLCPLSSHWPEKATVTFSFIHGTFLAWIYRTWHQPVAKRGTTGHYYLGGSFGT